MSTQDKNMASFSRGSDEDYSIVCLPCHRDKATMPAFGYCINCQEHLCHACYKHHNKDTPYRHHKNQDKYTMPSTQQLTDTVVHGPNTNNLITPCPHHKNEMIKLYCHDHKLLLCSICATLAHRPCHVEYIPDISKKMINSQDYEHTMDRMDKLLASSQAINDEFQKEKKDNIKSDREGSTQLNQPSTENKKSKQGIMIGDISRKPQAIADYSAQFNQLSSSDGTQLSSSDGTQLSSSAGTMTTITPTSASEICVKSSKYSEKKLCGISGMTVLPPDGLVLVDWENKTVKLVDVNRQSITAHLLLGIEDADFPYDITSTSSTQVAVTVPRRQHIQIVSVLDKVLSKSHTIPTESECWGICCHQDKLVVTYWNPGRLEILDMDGKVITRVDTDVFVWPRYVQANSNTIYVSDSMLSEVIMLNWYGEITGRIADIGNPAGLALVGDGSLLVCEGYRVYQVSDSMSSRIILQDVRYPRAVCVDDRRHKLYISRWTAVDKLDNNILVYNI